MILICDDIKKKRNEKFKQKFHNFSTSNFDKRTKSHMATSILLPVLTISWQRVVS